MKRKQVLLTGGIGSGKSTVGKLLAQRGACVIDADLMGHAVLESDGEAFGDVSAAFPRAVVGHRVDRSRLADEVFADPDRLRLLESLTHGAIRDRIESQLRGCEAPVVVVEVPLLKDFMGDGWLRVVVDAPERAMLDRATAREMKRKDVKRRMAAQPSRESWKKAADVVIDNGGDLADLAREVDRLWAMLVNEEPVR